MDLTNTAPRSPYETLEDIVFLPRAIDKMRAHLTGTKGAYNSHAGTSERMLRVLFGITPDDFEAIVREHGGAAGVEGDRAVLDELCRRAPVSAEDIEDWNQIAPFSGPLTQEEWEKHWQRLAASGHGHRREIVTQFDRLDLDEGRDVPTGGRRAQLQREQALFLRDRIQARRSALIMTNEIGAGGMAPTTSDADERLDAIAAECSGDFGFYARDLRSGRVIARRADESFPTASLIKVGLLVELERQVVDGTLTISQSLPLRDEDKVGGSSLLRHMSAGIQLPIRDWAFLMMQVSDNTATNVLMDLVGIERVNATMEREGFPSIRLHHKIDFASLWKDSRHLGEGSPRDFAELMAAILERRLKSVTPEACEDMLRLMEGVGAGERLARYLDYNPYATQQRERGLTPEETGPVVRFAGKTGSLTGVRTHAAVLWSDETPLRLAMCGMVSGSTDRRWSVDADALVAIGKAGRVAYEALSG